MPSKTKTRKSTTENEKETTSLTETQAAVSANNSIADDCETDGATLMAKLDKSSGPGSADIKKLQEARFGTVESIAFAPRKVF